MERFIHYAGRFSNFHNAKRFAELKAGGLRADDINSRGPGSPELQRGDGYGDCARDIRQECAHLPFPANSLLN